MMDEIKKMCVLHGVTVEQALAGRMRLSSGHNKRTLEVEDALGYFKYWIEGKVRSVPVTLANGKLESGDRYQADWHGIYTESGEVTSKERLLELVLQWLVMGYEPEELPNRVRNSFGIG
jgi:hypothetical protein